MKTSLFLNHYSLTNVFLCIVFSILINTSIAQTNSKRQFTFCKEKSDTIHIADLVNCVELIPSDSKLKVKSYVISLRMHEDFEDFDPNIGSTIIPDILNEIIAVKNKLDYIKIKDIIVMDGKEQKKFDGFKLYIK